jgi:hypothetical protein
MPPTRRTLRLFPALVPALVALCLLTSYVSPSLDTSSISTVEKEAWSDSSRCFHMMQDESPEIQPLDRFAPVNAEIREFREDIIGTKSHCCENLTPGEDGYCGDMLNVGEWTWLEYEVQQVDEDVVSILMSNAKNWGGSGTWFYSHPIVVSAKTGLPYSPPEVWSTQSIETLKNQLPDIFMADPCVKSGREEMSDPFNEPVLLALIEGLKADMENNPQLVVKNDEWHWVMDDHCRFSNACHRLWTVPTGVAFEP